MAKQQKKLGEILIEWGIISTREVAKALEHAKAKSLRIGEALVDLKLCSESNVYKALAQQHNMEYIDLDKSSVPPNAVNLIPDDLMRKYLILPLGKENGKLQARDSRSARSGDAGHPAFPPEQGIRDGAAPKRRIKTILDELFNTQRHQHHRQDDGQDHRPAARFAGQIAGSLGGQIGGPLDRQIGRS